MSPEPEKLDLADAAARSGYSLKTLRRYIKLGKLPAQKVRVVGRAGRIVEKLMIDIAHLDVVFPRPQSLDDDARRMAESVASAPRLTASQRIRILAILHGQEE